MFVRSIYYNNLVQISILILLSFIPIIYLFLIDYYYLNIQMMNLMIYLVFMTVYLNSISLFISSILYPQSILLNYKKNPI